jgi:hypothetical protein
LDTQTGAERWRFAEKGQHFLQIAFAEHAGAFVRVCWPYEHGGAFRLFRFEAQSGKASVITDLDQAGEFEFCLCGTRLLSSDGLLMDSATGRRDRSSSVCWTCYGVEARRLEVGVWMLRSALASRACEQEGERIMSKAKWGATATARPRAEQRRYVVANREIDALRARNLRLFKD